MHTDGTYRVLRVANSLILVIPTALMAVLWAWPKVGHGGFAWTLSIPVGIVVVLLARWLTVWRPVRRSIWLMLGATALLLILDLGGLVILSSAYPSQVTDVNAWTLIISTLLWPLLLLGCLFVQIILWLIFRRRSDAVASSADTNTTPGARPAMPSPIAPARSAPSPYGPSTTEPAVYPPREQGFAAPHGYVVASESAVIAHPSPIEPVLEPDAAQGRAIVPSAELRMLLEVAEGMGAHPGDAQVQLSFDGGEITVSSAGIALGEVPGSWDGEQRVSADARAADLLACLDNDAANGQQSIVDCYAGAAPRLVIRHEEGDDGGCDVPLSAPPA